MHRLIIPVRNKTIHNAFTYLFECWTMNIQRLYIFIDKPIMHRQEFEKKTDK